MSLRRILSGQAHPGHTDLGRVGDVGGFTTELFDLRWRDEQVIHTILDRWHTHPMVPARRLLVGLRRSSVSQRQCGDRTRQSACRSRW